MQEHLSLLGSPLTHRSVLLPLGRSKESSCLCVTSPNTFLRCFSSKIRTLKPVCLQFSRLESGLCAGRLREVKRSVVTAACSVGPCWILDSLFLVAWFKEGHTELRLVKVGATGKARAIRTQLGRSFNLQGLMDLAWWLITDEGVDLGWCQFGRQSCSRHWRSEGKCNRVESHPSATPPAAQGCLVPEIASDHIYSLGIWQMLLHPWLLLGTQKKDVTSAEHSLCQFLSGHCCSRAAVGPCS